MPEGKRADCTDTSCAGSGRLPHLSLSLHLYASELPFGCLVIPCQPISAAPHRFTAGCALRLTRLRLTHVQVGSFNQDIDAWNVSQVTDMRQFFCRVLAFDQPLGSWQVGRVRNMEQMFYESGGFDQDINAWECADRHSNLRTTWSAGIVA